MKFLDPHTESAVRDFLARIPADIRLDRAILFGSRARGEHRPDSDADVALILHERGDDGMTLMMLAELAYYAYLDTGIMLALNAGDNVSAVSRSYYAMFDIAQAALLRAGMTEDKLPRTHSGVIEAFYRHAIQSGQLIGNSRPN
jgi:predicted nucleotidyltransferase